MEREYGASRLRWRIYGASKPLSGHDDKLAKVAPLLEITGGKWEDFLGAAIQRSYL